MNSFVLVAYASLVVSRTLLQRLLACLNFTLDSILFTIDFSVCKKKRNDFCELWQQHKLLETMGMSKAKPDTYDEEYIHQFQPEPTPKIY